MTRGEVLGSKPHSVSPWPNCAWSTLSMEGRLQRGQPRTRSPMDASPRFLFVCIYYMQLCSPSQYKSTAGTWPSFPLLGGSPPWEGRQQGNGRWWRGPNFKDWIGFALKDSALWYTEKNLLPGPIGSEQTSCHFISYLPGSLRVHCILYPYFFLNYSTYNSYNYWAYTISLRNHPTSCEYSRD